MARAPTTPRRPSVLQATGRVPASSARRDGKGSSGRGANKGSAAAAGVRHLAERRRPPCPRRVRRRRRPTRRRRADGRPARAVPPRATDRNVAHAVNDPGGGTAFLLHVRGTLYANFGVGRLDLFRRLGGFDERFFLNGDPDFSLKVWHAGLEVVPAVHGAHRPRRARRRPARPTPAGATPTTTKLFDKWALPARGTPAATTFDPAPLHPSRGLHRRLCRLRGMQPRRRKDAEENAGECVKENLGPVYASDELRRVDPPPFLRVSVTPRI